MYSLAANGVNNQTCYENSVHSELLKQIYVGYQAPMPVSNPTSAATPNVVSSSSTSYVNKPYGIVDKYLYFDSIYRNTSVDITTGALSFSIVNINNGFPLTDIIGLELEPFYLPRLQNSNYPASPDFFFFNRAFLQCTTLPTNQSYLAANGNIFNFELEISNDNSISVAATPIHPRIYFESPISSLSSWDLQFTMPYNFTAMPLLNDQLTIVAVPLSNPATFNVVDNTTASLGPVGSSNVAVYITNFNSSNATLNANVNSPQGTMVTNIISTTQFSISAFDFSIIPAGETNDTANMIIGKNRIAMGVHFISLRTYITNHITIAHP
ncbi:MAG: hypothetical protein ACYCPT_12190 [Acidimicrobiales bacterium]